MIVIQKSEVDVERLDNLVKAFKPIVGDEIPFFLHKESYAVFQDIKQYLNIYTFKDYRGVLEYQDFESLAYLGFIKAIKSYDPSREMASKSWVYKITHQFIIKEIKRVHKKDKAPYNESTMSMTLDEIIESQGGDLAYELLVDSIEIVNTTRQTLIYICYKLQKYIGPPANKTFQLKFFFPELSRKSMAKILGYRRRNALSKKFKGIKNLMELPETKDYLKKNNLESLTDGFVTSHE